MTGTGPSVLFEDPMAEGWQENWFLDGKRAILEHRDGGLYYEATPSNVDKRVDRATFDAHHAVLWTKRVFEGDIRISYDFTRAEGRWGTTLLYIQAQGIGTPPWEEDIYATRELREIPNMGLYFSHMNLLSLTFRGNIRCRRYPLRDAQGDPVEGLFAPMVDYDGMPAGKTYRIEVEKRAGSLTLRIRDKQDPANTREYVWDTSKSPGGQQPNTIRKGRIGLRHMGGNKVTYRNFRVDQL
jgi:hypothetical protein